MLLFFLLFLLRHWKLCTFIFTAQSKVPHFNTYTYVLHAREAIFKNSWKISKMNKNCSKTVNNVSNEWACVFEWVYNFSCERVSIFILIIFVMFCVESLFVVVVVLFASVWMDCNFKPHWDGVTKYFRYCVKIQFWIFGFFFVESQAK